MIFYDCFIKFEFFKSFIHLGHNLFDKSFINYRRLTGEHFSHRVQPGHFMLFEVIVLFKIWLKQKKC